MERQPKSLSACKLQRSQAVFILLALETSAVWQQRVRRATNLADAELKRDMNHFKKYPVDFGPYLINLSNRTIIELLAFHSWNIIHYNINFPCHTEIKWKQKTVKMSIDFVCCPAEGSINNKCKALSLVFMRWRRVYSFIRLRSTVHAKMRNNQLSIHNF